MQNLETAITFQMLSSGGTFFFFFFFFFFCCFFFLGGGGEGWVWLGGDGVRNLNSVTSVTFWETAVC